MFGYFKLIATEWRMYASANYANIGSDNGLSSYRRKAIIWTNAPMLPCCQLDP